MLLAYKACWAKIIGKVSNCYFNVRFQMVFMAYDIKKLVLIQPQNDCLFKGKMEALEN